MRNRFDQQLYELNREIIEMGAMCEEAIASAAKALTTGHAKGVLLQSVLNLIPDSGISQRTLHDFIQFYLVSDAVGTWAVGNVIVNAHREGIGLLEHHADLLA